MNMPEEIKSCPRMEQIHTYYEVTEGRSCMCFPSGALGLFLRRGVTVQF